MTKRILHIFGTMDRGGAEMRTLELYGFLKQKGYQFEFLSLSGSHGELDETIAQMGGTTHLVPLNFLFPIIFFQLLKRHNYDCVHSHVHLFSAPILFVALLAGVRQRIAHFRSTGDGVRCVGLRKLRNALFSWTLNHVASDIIGVSKASLDLAVGSGWKLDRKCRVLYSGISLQPYATEPDLAGVREEFGFQVDDQIVIHVGRQVPEKNHSMVLSIFKEIAQRSPKARLLLVGKTDPQINGLIQHEANSLGISDFISICGVRTDIPRLLSASNILLFPSIREGLPGVVLEAAAARIPIVASRIPGIEELDAFLPQLTLHSLSETAKEWAASVIRLMGKPIEQERQKEVFPATFDSVITSRAFETLYAGASTQNA